MNQEVALNLVDDLKSEIGIPEETCPVIDSVLSRVRSALRNLNAEAFDDVQVDLLEIKPLMEVLRKDNHNLRELGKEWHKLAEDLAYQFPARSRQ